MNLVKSWPVWRVEDRKNILGASMKVSAACKHVIPSSMSKSWSQRTVSVDLSSKSCNHAVMGVDVIQVWRWEWRSIMRFLAALTDHLVSVRPAVGRPLLDTIVLHRPGILHLLESAYFWDNELGFMLTSCIRVFSSCGRGYLCLRLRLRSLSLRRSVRLLLITTIAVVKVL